MESVMLTVKFALFLAMEIFVVAMFAGVLILALYQIIKERILESRRLDEIVPEPRQATSVNATTARHS